MTLIEKTDHTIVKFTINSKLDSWRLVNDVIMGGESKSNISINKNGNAVFEGEVSLENNGGFSLLRHRFGKLNISKFKTIKIRLKGDGKRYQFRAKASIFKQHSYIGFFQSNGNWQVIEIELAKLKPTFRGRELSIPNFPGSELEEIGFLIGNKKNEKFKLIIDTIILE
ncbi:CIA30 family protein [Lutibacter citreus]|uniref:CIA30 family protein n=1 Tax=Lutibacter citreus TaxID=2138210 RepID=UPI000DBE265A|nr:CIA30 family protein [Lutibacter citreus]